MAVRAVVWAVVLLAAAGAVRGAGYCDGRESSPEAQELRLRVGEQARHGPAPGKGLIVHNIEADVVVAGGGSAGVSAALAAARSGAKTVLVHGNPVLGGNSGSQIKLAMVGACGPRARDDNALKMECREGGIVEEYTLDNAVGNPFRVGELFSLDLYSKMREEPNIDLYLDTWLVAVEMNGTKIARAIAENQISQNRYNISAKVFIDTTGDGRLGAEAGAEFIMGREGKDKYHESVAVERADNETEGSSLAWVSVDKGTPQPFTPPPWARKFKREDFRYRSVDFFQHGYWWNEVSFPFNTITDNNDIRDTLLANLFGIWDYIKNSGDHPKSSTWALDWFGNVPCKREGRRFIGQYVSTQNDVISDFNHNPPQKPTIFYDNVAYAGWPFDLHNPKGMNDTEHPPYSSFRTPYMFSTPLRSLVSKNVENLMFAGRLASFSHVVFGSQRVMKTGSTMGQAAGTAAALCAKKGITPVALTQDRDSVWSVQQQLLRDDAYIIGFTNQDPRDHALRAKFSASSELMTDDINGSAVNVITGQTRAVVTDLKSTSDTGGVAVGQGVPGSNRWISTELPATLALSWDQPVEIAQVQLVFDTGMHRKLTFSVRENGVGIWGAQPETVRDYVIEGLPAGSSQWRLLCNVTDNYQRKRVHNTPCDPNAPPYWPPLNPGNNTPPPPAGTGVQMQPCDPTEKQQWKVFGNGTIGSVQYPGMCLSFDKQVPAPGGHGNNIMLAPCGQAPEWKFKSDTLRSTIALSKPVQCANYPPHMCDCVKPVAPDNTVVTGTSIELWMCDDSTAYAMDWTAATLPDSNSTLLLMTGGQCLDAGALPTPLGQHQQPESSGPMHPRLFSTPALHPNTPDTYSSLRITVLATNGISQARINEVRVYGTDGLDKFPQRS